MVTHYNRHNRPKHAGQEPYAGYVQNAKGEFKTDKDGKKIPLDPGLCKQEMTADTDINRIMAKYEPSLATKLLHCPAVGGDYGDFCNVKDFQASLEAVNEAQEAFAALPAKLRARFNNNPVEMLQFVHNPANREEMIELGMAPRPEPKPAGNAVPAQNSGEKSAPPAPQGKEGVKA